MKTGQSCPLCSSLETFDFLADKARCYLKCENCNLIFVPVEFHLSIADEKSEYDLHENSQADQGYRRFLSRLFEPINEIVLKQFGENAAGLDFGCGPGPTLSVMFQESGHSMEIYDPLYAPDRSVLNRQYDFVTASEVVEHFRQPAVEFQKLWSLVKPGGVLGLMTKLALDQDAFSNWHYKNDPTHVAFYSREAFAWLGRHWQAQPQIVGDDVIVFQKPGD